MNQMIKENRTILKSFKLFLHWRLLQIVANQIIQLIKRDEATLCIFLLHVCIPSIPTLHKKGSSSRHSTESSDKWILCRAVHTEKKIQQ